MDVNLFLIYFFQLAETTDKLVLETDSNNKFKKSEAELLQVSAENFNFLKIYFEFTYA